MADENETYQKLYKRGKRLFKEGRYKECLVALKQAYDVNPNKELQIKINKIEKEMNAEDDEESMNFKCDNKILIGENYYVNGDMYKKLYKYQQDGVKWLFSLFKTKKGGILADDMGLGKTVQLIFFVRELIESDIVKHVLIVMPKSLIINWEREFKTWAPDIRMFDYYGNDRGKNKRKILLRSGVLLTTFNMVVNNWAELNENDTKWDIIVLDEGHKIKNSSTKTFKSVNSLRAKFRVVMTGTAVQNNLKELWTLFDFTHQGSLLGTYPTFKLEYERPITESRKKDARDVDKVYGNLMSKSLKNIIQPFFLRRTKEEITTKRDSGVPELSQKNDMVVWVRMSEIQLDIYQKFLELDEIKVLLTRSEKRSPLMELNILKKICDHPRLLSVEHFMALGLKFCDSIQNIDVEDLLNESGKLMFLRELLRNLVANGHKSLVFSQSKIVLNMIQKLLKYHHIPFLRLDGDVLSTVERQTIVDNFNTDEYFKVLLLTTQVGGVGITLTAADRVIIYDPSWNPATDSQAVDRVYRIGQLKNVVIYRLITCGGVEEKIYRRQIFKESLNRMTTGSKKTDDNVFRYFTQGELRELFTLENSIISETQKQLQSMHASNRKTYPDLDNHIDWLQQQNISGVSDHDLMFSKEDQAVMIDDEVAVKIVTESKVAEDKLKGNAGHRATVEDYQLQMMMENISISGNLSKKSPQLVHPENLFIPSKKDIKRSVFNVPTALRQSKLNFKPQSALSTLTPTSNGTFIDLTNVEPSIALSRSIDIGEENSSNYESNSDGSRIDVEAGCEEFEKSYGNQSQFICIDVESNSDDSQMNESLQNINRRMKLTGMHSVLDESDFQKEEIKDNNGEQIGEAEKKDDVEKNDGDDTTNDQMVGVLRETPTELFSTNFIGLIAEPTNGRLQEDSLYDDDESVIDESF